MKKIGGNKQKEQKINNLGVYLQNYSDLLLYGFRRRKWTNYVFLAGSGVSSSPLPPPLYFSIFYILSLCHFASLSIANPFNFGSIYSQFFAVVVVVSLVFFNWLFYFLEMSFNLGDRYRKKNRTNCKECLPFPPRNEFFFSLFLTVRYLYRPSTDNWALKILGRIIFCLRFS